MRGKVPRNARFVLTEMLRRRSRTLLRASISRGRRNYHEFAAQRAVRHAENRFFPSRVHRRAVFARQRLSCARMRTDAARLWVAQPSPMSEKKLKEKKYRLWPETSRPGNISRFFLGGVISGGMIFRFFFILQLIEFYFRGYLHFGIRKLLLRCIIG